MVAAARFLDMTWSDVQQVTTDDCLVVIPVGQVVQHGPHLPIGTDVRQAEGVSAAVVQELGRHGLPAVVGPTIAFGYSPAHETFPGYVNLRPEVLTDEIEDVAACLARQGLRRQAAIMFGPGSWPSLNIAATRLSQRGAAEMVVIDGLATARAVGSDLLGGVDANAGKFDVHAGELETSLMLAIAPDLVRMERAVTHYSELYASFAQCACTRGPLQQQIAAVGLRDWKAFGEEGVTGDATLATPEKGRTILDRTVTEMARHLKGCLFPH